jgi:hypothetical protein
MWPSSKVAITRTIEAKLSVDTGLSWMSGMLAYALFLPPTLSEFMTDCCLKALKTPPLLLSFCADILEF